MILVICVSTVIALIAVELYFRYNPANRLMALIPGPKILPLIGNGLDIVLDPELFFKFSRRMAKDYGGKVSRLTALNQRAINIYEPEDIEVILTSSKHLEKPIPYTFLQKWLGEGLLLSFGSKWQHRRKLLTPAFHFNILKKFARSFSDHTEDLVDLLDEEAGHGTDITPLITNLTLKVMCETSMGISTKADIQAISNKYFQALHTLGKCVIGRVSKIWYFPDITFNLSSIARTQNKALKNLHGFTSEIIQKRRELFKPTFKQNRNKELFGSRAKMAMLDLLLKQEAEGDIDADGIREEVDTFMFEGHDTTAASLQCMLMRIANEPNVQTKINEEMMDIFGESDRAPSYEDLNEMKYLERCIKESLRLYPGVPMIARMLREETILNGYTVPANTICNIHIYDIHRREQLFPNPEQFDPDRFLPENISARHPFAYIPFSAGPRNCIGQKFAMLEMKSVISGLLRRFVLEPITKAEDVVFVSDLVLRAKHPIYVRFIRRK